MRREGSLVERIEALERQNRRWRGGLAVVAGALLWPFFLGAQSTGAKTVEVERLVLRDAKGTIRAELVTQPDGSPLLKLLDEAGVPSLVLRGAPAGPILEMADGRGGTAWMSASTTGSSLVLSKNAAEVELATNASGYPSARLRDKDGKLVWEVPTTGAGS